MSGDEVKFEAVPEDEVEAAQAIQTMSNDDFEKDIEHLRLLRDLRFALMLLAEARGAVAATQIKVPEKWAERSAELLDAYRGSL